jgi:predicted thioredoxin/glutaredoxin
MAERSPLLFETRLGMLKPANAVAEAAMREIKGRVRIEIKGGVANERRRGLYWSVAALVVPLLNDQFAMTLDESDLHDITRTKLKLYDEQRLPSGEVYRKLRSTSNRAMNEAERAEYTDRALQLWSTWCGVDVTTLRAEAA